MLIAILTTIVIVTALALSIRSERNGLIGEHRYNNMANDASAARDDHLA